jgi:hypothetical protein
MGTGHEAQERLRVAVVTTRDRPDDYRDCVAALAPQVHYLITIAHMHPSYVWDVLEVQHDRLEGLQVVPYYEDPPNISRMWNMGLDSAPYAAVGRPYDVAVLNDDAVVSPTWFEDVTRAMHGAGSAAGCVARSDDGRMSGFAFILNGDKGLRADEQFQWWYGDDDLERRARDAGGVMQIWNRATVEHRHPNSTTTGALAEIAEQDGIRYQEKWG